jgi:hypothetical protein
MQGSLPKREDIDPQTPLRLYVAAALAFPDGSMTACGLRREIARGRLLVERIAGKDYTTLANIERMREQCRVEAKVPGCGSGQAQASPPKARPNRQKCGLDHHRRQQAVRHGMP